MKAKFKQNKTQSETADFVLGAATLRTGRNIRVVFDFGPFGPLCETLHHPQNRKYVTYYYYITVRGGPSHDNR